MSDLHKKRPRSAKSRFVLPHYFTKYETLNGGVANFRSRNRENVSMEMNYRSDVPVPKLRNYNSSRNTNLSGPSELPTRKRHVFNISFHDAN